MDVLQKCPVCRGHGLLRANYYDVPGETCSYADYNRKNNQSTTCRLCNGKGFLGKIQTIHIPLDLNPVEAVYVLSDTEYKEITKDAERHSMEIGDYIDWLVKNQRLADGQQ